MAVRSARLPCTARMVPLLIGVDVLGNKLRHRWDELCVNQQWRLSSECRGSGQSRTKAFSKPLVVLRMAAPHVLGRHSASASLPSAPAPDLRTVQTSTTASAGAHTVPFDSSRPSLRTSSVQHIHHRPSPVSSSRVYTRVHAMADSQSTPADDAASATPRHEEPPSEALLVSGGPALAAEDARSPHCLPLPTSCIHRSTDPWPSSPVRPHRARHCTMAHGPRTR